MSRLVDYQPQSNGTDWSKPSINVGVNAISVHLTSPETNFVTALDITGKGYFKKAVIAMTPTPTRHIKITVDGVLMVNFKGIGETGVLGVCVNDLIDPATIKMAVGTGSFNYTLDGLTQYPDTTGTMCFAGLSQPIYFDKSLKVEVSTSSSSETIPVDVEYVVL